MLFLYTSLDWLALSVACSELSSVNLGKSLSSALPNFIKDFGGFLFWKNGVTMYSEDVVDSADAKAFTEEGKFCLRILTHLHAFINGPECDMSMDCCGYRGHRENVVDCPIRRSCVQV